MKKSRYLVILPLLLLAAFASVVVSAQEVPTLPVDVTVQVTLGVTTEPTIAAPTVVPPTVVLPTVVPPTVAATVQATLQATVQVTTQATTTPTRRATTIPTRRATSSPTLQATTSATAQATTSGATATQAPGTQVATVEATAEATALAPIAPEVDVTPVADSGFVRFAHFAGANQTADIYIDNVLLFRDLAYPGVTRWIALSPGTHTVVITPADSSMSDELLAPFVVNAGADVFTTVAILENADSTLTVAQIVEDYADLLPGTAGFTFVNALVASPIVNLMRDDVAYFTGIDFAGFSSLRVDSGEFDVSAVAADDPSDLIAEDEALELRENTYNLVALLEKGGEITLLKITTDESAVAIARGTLPIPGRLLDALRANDNLSSAASAFGAGGDLTDRLSNGAQEYTVFAPADAALTNAGSDWQPAPESYVVEGKYTSQELIDAGTLTALDGTPLVITVENNGIFVNGVQLIDVNVPATNGIIHVLNSMLMREG